MLTWIIALSILAPGQTPDAFFGMIPKDVPTFQILERNVRKGYGALQLDGQWVRDASEITPAKRPMIVYDTPWAPATEMARYGRFSYEVSAEALRVQRLKEGWKEAGYTFVSTEVGDLPVLEENLALAERARAMARSMDAPAPGTDAGALVDETSGVVAPPGFLQLWGGHLAVVAVALFLLGVVGKVFLFNDDDSWEKVG